MIQLSHFGAHTQRKSKQYIEATFTLTCFSAVLFTEAKIWKPSKCLSMDEDKESVHINTVKYYSAVKMKKF